MTRTAVDAMPEWARPVRIPGEIAITHTDPPVALAGEKRTWRLPFELAKDVAPTAVLKLQLFGGRSNKGALHGAQVEERARDGYVSAQLQDGRRLSMAPDRNAGTYAVSVPAEGLRKGQVVAVTLGDRAGGGGGIEAGSQRLLNKFFVLYNVPSEDAEPTLPSWAGPTAWTSRTEDLIVAACTMHVLGAALDRIRAYVPSQCRPGDRIPVLVRPEDEYGNLSHQHIASAEISLEGKRLEVHTEPVPDSTCLRAWVVLSGEGTHRLRVRDPRSGAEVTTNPVVCAAADGPPVFWGMIHGHTEISDGTGKLDQYFHQLRHEVGLDFGAPGDHDHLWETPDELWRMTRDAVRRWYVPGEFVTFLGYEWAKWRRNGDGDRNVYYLDDDRPMYRSDDGQYPSPPDLFEALTRSGEKAIVIPHHTAHGGNFCDWKDHSPRHERLVEIFQMRGSYECGEEDNPAPEGASKHAAYTDGYVRNALELGWRVGFTAGGDDHSGRWGTEALFTTGGKTYKQGLMSVRAEARTREAIWEALHDRRVVATTGARMLLNYTLDGHPMGSEVSVKECPALEAERTVAVDFHGTAAVDRIDIIRNNRVVHSVPGRGRMDVAFSWQDTSPVARVRLPSAKFCDHPFTFYYVRALQTDREVAWASPIWIDP